MITAYDMFHDISEIACDFPTHLVEPRSQPDITDALCTNSILQPTQQRIVHS